MKRSIVLFLFLLIKVGVLLGPANGAYHLKRGGVNMEGEQHVQGEGKVAAGKEAVCPMASAKKGGSDQKSNMITSNTPEKDAEDTESGEDISDDTSEGLEDAGVEEAAAEEAAMEEEAMEEEAAEEAAAEEVANKEAADLKEKQYNEMKQRKWKAHHGAVQASEVSPKKNAMPVKGGGSKVVKAHSGGNSNVVNALKSIESHDNSSEGKRKGKGEKGTNEENESLYEEKRQKILMIHLLKTIKEHLDRQKQNFNSFLSFLSESYASYERFHVFKKVNDMYSGVGEEMAITSQSFLSLQEESTPRCGKQNVGGVLRSGAKAAAMGLNNGGSSSSGGGMDEESEEEEKEDATEDEEGENQKNEDAAQKGDAPQNGDNSDGGKIPGENPTNTDDQDKDAKKSSEKMKQIKGFLYEMLQSEELGPKQKEYLQVILQILTLEDDLLQKEQMQVQLNKKIIDVLLGKSNELRDIAVHLSREGSGEAEGNQRVDLAQNIVSNLLNFSVELKNTGNIVYNNIQGQGDLLQSIEKSINKAEDGLKNVRVHTEYKGRKKDDPTVDPTVDPSNDPSNDDPSSNDVVQNKGGATTSRDATKSEFLQYCDAGEAEANSTCPFKSVSSSKSGSAAMKQSSGGDLQKDSASKGTKNKFTLDETMKNHFFNNFVKDSVTLRKLYRLLYDMF
ncbi:hypothetical protein C922_04383 [Plasmodium inui San Antonio 1]|uniref:Rhoptry-associated leucine zipper-like protein 1 n=1 Tax=Plasmodium inui San Antonio 1 TaxID=1237626 RepID=W7A7Z4_9APIC|nr:hypothetical protein C922_04383 [Plasmodium inui San Antonio 1]EUD65254.1 hypothetical protein C922_04383 [Plasmodium inui San Antonio 1]